MKTNGDDSRREIPYSPKSLQTEWNKFQESICRDVGGSRQCKYLTRGMPGRGLIVYDRILTSYLADLFSPQQYSKTRERKFCHLYKKK
jgi:hypothetical protein